VLLLLKIRLIILIDSLVTVQYNFNKTVINILMFYHGISRDSP